MLALKTQERKPGAKSALLRNEGLIPAVCYGPKFPATSVTVSLAEFSKIWKQAGESTVVVLETDKGKVNTLIHDVQVHAVKGTPLHADFYVVEAGKEVEVHVPIEFEGVAPAVKELGGILVKVLHELEIKAMPEKLPHAIIVDVGALADFDSQILVGDIKLPTGVTAVTHDTEVVASIARAVEEKEEEVAPVDLSAIEVEKKGKKEEEDVEGQP
ncbi:MAG: 50S ribosomal protein L25 [Minisyncoccota bacterium]